MAIYDFRIIMMNNNIEVLSKILNRIAAEHDCRIEYDTETRKVNSRCDAKVRLFMIKEVMGILNAN